MKFTVFLLLAALLTCTLPSAQSKNRVSLAVAASANLTRAHFSAASEADENLCAEFGWQGAVDTDINFKEFFARNHTIATRFMIQYPRSYQAPLLTVKGTGNFLVAIAGYGEGRIKAERLLLKLGSKTIYYTAGDKLAAKRWHWLAWVREGQRFRLYLDGAELKPDSASSEISLDAFAPAGTLRLGRGTSGDAQFYGLMDDVAVFNSALSQKSLKGYYEQTPRLNKTETGLIAAYLFDKATEAEGNAREALRRRATFSGNATEVKVSPSRDSNLDAGALPPPKNRTRVLLPFQPGQAWKVIQGYGQELSHNNGGCFALDFARVDGPSQEQPVYASAAGLVVAISDNNDPEPSDNISKDNFNYLQVEIAEGELITYLHMKNGSLVAALKSFAPSTFPELFPPFPLDAGVQIGKVGNTWLKEQPSNWHLHFAGVPYLNSPVSIPFAFSDYELFDPRSKTWRRIERGVPEQNQIVRRTTPL